MVGPGPPPAGNDAEADADVAIENGGVAAQQNSPPGLKEVGVIEDDDSKRLTLVLFDNGDLFVLPEYRGAKRWMVWDCVWSFSWCDVSRGNGIISQYYVCSWDIAKTRFHTPHWVPAEQLPLRSSRLF